MAWKEWRDWVKRSTSQETNRLDSIAIELETRINREFFRQATDRQILIYGCPSHFGATPRLIELDLWRTLTNIDWENSSAGGNGGADTFFREIRVYPPLLAPCRVDLVAGCSLAEAFKKYVLNDPEVAAFAKQGMRLAPEFERVFVQGRCTVHGVEQWPVAYENRLIVGAVHPDPKMRSVFDRGGKSDPLEVVIAAAALKSRIVALIDTLRSGEIEAVGLSVVPGHPCEIFRSIWSHEEFSFNAHGDVFADNPDSDGRCNRVIKRWHGVLLRRSHASAAKQQGYTHAEFDRGNLLAARATDQGDAGQNPTPFTVEDVVRVRSLADVLKKLIFKHPEIQMLAPKARDAAEGSGVLFEDDAGLIGHVYGHDEPLLPLRYFPKEDWDSEAPILPSANADGVAIWEDVEESLPASISDYYTVLNLRAATLFKMLQRGEIIGIGHTVDGHPVPLIPTVWSHEDFYVHPPTGDMYEAGPDEMVKRWTGVILVRPSGDATAMFGEVIDPIIRDTRHVTEIRSERPETPAHPKFHGEHTTRDEIRLATVEADSSTQRKSIANVNSRKTAHEECRTWLEGMMRASPNERKESKHRLRETARHRWSPILSERSFIAAWAEAIENTGAVAWSAAGAPKKRS